MLFHLALHANATGRCKALHGGQGQAFVAGRPHDGIGQRVLAALVQAGGKPQQTVGIETRQGQGAVEHRLAFGQRAGFVDDQGVDLAKVFDGRRIAEQHALGGTAPCCHHDRHGCGQPQRAGAGDDEHGHRVDQPVAPAGRGAKKSPGHQRQQGDGHHRPHKIARHRVGHALHRRFGALGLHHHLHDLRQHGTGAHPLGLHGERTAGVEGGTDQFVAAALGHRHGFAGEHGFVYRAAAVQHQTVHRHFFAGAHAQAVADVYVGERNVGLAAVVGNAAGGFGRQAKQGFDGRRGLRAGFELQQLAQQGERNDRRRRLEVHRHPAHGHKRCRKHLRCQRGHQAVDKGRARAQADQRPHIRAAVAQRLPAAHKKRRTRPQHHRQAQDQLDPALHLHVKPMKTVPQHGQHHHGNAQWQGPPEAAAKVQQLGVFGLVQAGHFRLQRHAALRATARVVLPHLGVHGAGVGGPGHRSLGRCFGRSEVFLRAGRKLGFATRTAKIIAVA